MVIKFEDMDESNWIKCDSCKKLYKYPSYNSDLKLDEYRLCTRSYVK